ncbi:MAG: MFS transporter [Myxococcales bacterium]|nr:MFS transporter [Myxococcales bacterium]
MRHVYIGTLLLGLAYGIALSVIAVYLDERGFEKREIGNLAAAFAAGIVLLSIPAGALIRRFSAKTVVTSAVLAYAAVTLAFPHINSLVGIAGLRFVDGAASVSIWVSCETVLLARAQTGQKALVTSLYAVFMALGYILGPLLSRGLVALWPLSAAFSVAGALALGVGVYFLLFLSRDADAAARLDPGGEASSDVQTRLERADGPAREATNDDLGSLGVLWRIKTSCFATFAYGYFQASVVLFLPLFLMAEKHVSKENTIYVTACFALGMVLFTNPAGRIGDRFGHLLTMRTLAVIGTLMIASFAWLDSFPWMLVAVFVAGATLASISPMSLALQGLVVPARDYSRATAIYNAFYAAGMLIGPPISSLLFERLGGAPMLHHLAAMWCGFIGFTLIFRKDDPAHDERTAVIPLQR